MLNYVFTFAVYLITANAFGQMYIGITGDYGNQVNINPNAEANLKSKRSLSTSITFIKQNELRKNWLLQYGTAVGVLGYQINAQSNDTLSTRYHSSTAFPDYNTLYLNAHIAFGRQFNVKDKVLSLLVGGGATRYLSIYESGASGGIRSSRSLETVFEYNMYGATDNLKGFMEIQLQAKLNRWLLLGLRYRHHFEPVLKGDYNFYHMKNRPSGTLSLTQRALSILFLVRIGGKSNSK